MVISVTEVPWSLSVPGARGLEVMLALTQLLPEVADAAASAGPRGSLVPAVWVGPDALEAAPGRVEPSTVLAQTALALPWGKRVVIPQIQHWLYWFPVLDAQ